MRLALISPLAAVSSILHAQAAGDDALAFGALEHVRQISLSPDGARVAYVTPRQGTDSAVMVRGTEDGAVARPALFADGKEGRLSSCRWVSNNRLACIVSGTVQVENRFVFWSRVIAVDADGAN